MPEFLNVWLPNVTEKWNELLEACGQTLLMVGVAGLVSFLFGLLLGVILTITKKHGIMEKLPIYHLLDKVINVFRSIPFIILLTALFPFTRLIVGTAIGTKGAMLPLIIGTTPFFARQIETALSELDQGLVEAAQSMGDGTLQIIYRIYLRESIPSIARAVTITFVNLVGLTAMAGAVGGGGLGNFAISYGPQRNQPDIIFVVVLLLLLLVSLIQGAGGIIVKKTSHI